MHHDNVVSKVIAGVMGSQWSHTFGVYEQTARRTMLLETSDFEVGFASFDRYLVKAELSMIVMRPTRMLLTEREHIAELAALQEGTVYGYLQLPTLGLRRGLMRLGMKNVPNLIRQGQVCTAPWLYGYTKSNIPGLKGIDPESIDTEEFFQAAKTAKWEDGTECFEVVFQKKRGEIIKIGG